ncbi:MAG: Activator of (R)-2-hydroxyglutaryl-CoA dehydratase [Candidatus Jettenia ecosi]|uniref:Activator of (R)-2-hydroxyglutaryl-CoA dehydratase n=1 Tax=Candidatus Jettenia ecosi TaxID=2494326 RepID=A0A533QJQ7_9BACT|nr:MAG: Activator of (R)-2-hydroxyglutaryl-CoA dehydratase [Candidatus Jettenia ecosi]
MSRKKYIGLDIGSVSVKAVLINEHKEILEDHYIRSHGQPVETFLLVLKDLFNRTHIDDIDGMAITGSGGKLVSELMNIAFINEVVAHSKAATTLHPEVRTIVEIGGEDSKLMLIERDPTTQQTKVSDFSMNTMCAAGTGSFLDQQATRLGIAIEKEFGELALKSKNPPRIAGRCSVFAKTDMIHLQQEGTPVHDIVAGLCYAMARNFKSNIGKGKEFFRPIVLQGGVAANVGMVKAFEDILEVKLGELIIPKYFKVMGAIGAVFTIMDKGIHSPFRGLKEIEEYLRDRSAKASNLEPLRTDNYKIIDGLHPVIGDEKIEAYVGVDVGSISTNVVVIDKHKNVLSRRYLMTAGRPLEAVKQGLYEVGLEIGDKVVICGAGTTGSGRYLTGDFIGADIAKNEITAHATAAACVDKNVDTIFEIGGQDSKFIRLENGAIVDFAMNKVCAAGTGSFLEEQAEKLSISIKSEFSKRALSSCCPSHLGERCTVFMESDLNHHQQRGTSKDDLLAGLSYSVVLNFINRVVEDRKIGNTIFFQGGVAANRGVKAAFEKVTGKKIIVPPHHDIMGAIGSAIIAMEEKTWGKSRFKGFDLRHKRYELSSFVCKDCSNICEIRKVSIEGENPLHYGSRCGKFDDERSLKKGKHLPRLFRERKEALFNTYKKNKPDQPIGKKIGIPQVSTFHDFYPMWKAFFIELGFDVMTSSDTNKDIVYNGVEVITAETCFPIKVAHGHVMDLLDRDIDYLFLPSVINLTHASSKLTHSYACPYVQCIPYLVCSAIDFREKSFKVLSPIIHFEYGEDYVNKTLRQMARSIGRTGKVIEASIKAAHEAQQAFNKTLEARGKEILEKLGENEKAFVLISRSYNGCDTGMNLGLPEKLRDLGIMTIPLDFLKLDLEDIAHDYPNMYWKTGQKFLAAARLIAKDKRLYPLYITNFGCGPDSFITKFFTKELEGKPCLTIEIDEHSSDVGAITRCEAFIDSLKNVKPVHNGKRLRETIPVEGFIEKKKRTIYIPYMCDHGRMIAASMKANGVLAEALPMANRQSVDIGRKFTSGKECYPAILTTGDIVKKALNPDFDPESSAFFMATASGPCRFGQYNTFHRMVLNELGFHNVPIYTMDQGENYGEDTKKLGTHFRKLAWNGIMYIDLLQKLQRETRPYEVNKGETDVLYENYVKKSETALEKHLDIIEISREACKAFTNIKVDRSKPRPLIGVIGETYVRCNEFANNFLARNIERLGGEAFIPPFAEWINYIAHCRRENCLSEKNYKGFLGEFISDIVQRYDAYRLTQVFKGRIRHFLKDTSIKELIKKGKPYIDDSYKGDPVLSMGKAIEYFEEGFDGIVNVIPFHCMPGTVVNGVLEKFQRDFNGLPCLKLSFDGQEQTNGETRLEAFIHQAYQRMESKLNSKKYGKVSHRQKKPLVAFHSQGKDKERKKVSKKEVFSE